MTTATDFQSVSASVFPSQLTEITISKQPVLSEHGREVRSALSQLPPEISRIILAPYAQPRPSLFTATEAAVMTRELAIENAAKEVDLDQSWLNSATSRRMDEVGLSADDSWNTGP